MLFGTLLNRCQARGVAALCYLKQTAVKHKPRIVALLPSSPDDPGLSGFHVIHLSFRNEIRLLDYDKLTARIGQGEDSKPHRATRDQIEAAKNIVKKLPDSAVDPVSKTIFNPEKFKDATLHTWWACIETSALEKQGPIKPAKDSTLPDNNWIVKRLGTLANDFSKLVYLYGYNPERAPAKVKAPKNLDEVEQAKRNGTVKD